MGITWIIGVVVIDSKIDALLPLAYIFTIFVAFQGLFIFVIFVLLSKQVRENYIKWWKAKVAESDFLSRHFGDKSLTTTKATVKIAANLFLSVPKLTIQFSISFRLSKTVRLVIGMAKHLEMWHHHLSKIQARATVLKMHTWTINLRQRH